MRVPPATCPVKGCGSTRVYVSGRQVECAQCNTISIKEKDDKFTHVKGKNYEISFVKRRNYPEGHFDGQ